MKYPAIVYPSRFEASDIVNASVSRSIVGSAKLTYFTSSEVLQVYPSIAQELPTPLLVSINRWMNVSVDNSLAFNEWLVALVEKQNIPGSWQVIFPQITKFGMYEEDSLEFPWVLSKRIRGVGLDEYLRSHDDVFEKDPSIGSIFESLVTFIAQWHRKSLSLLRDGKPSIGIGQSSLTDFYLERLGFLLEGIGILMEDAIKEYAEAFSRVQSILYKHINNISLLVDPCEETVLIHGDFRRENLLIDESCKLIWILDYEQGVCGGDWLSDLWKFGVLADGVLSHDADISSDFRQKLQKSYLDGIETKGSLAKFEVLNRNDRLYARINLMRLDLLVSVLLFRYLLGWHFYETQDRDDRKIRGDRFILDLIDQFFSLQ